MTIAFNRRTLLQAAAAAAVPLTRSRAQAGRGPLRIGLLSDMSGPYRDVSGATSVACARLAIQEFGNQGFEIQLLTADHQNKPDLAAAIARQWVAEDNVDMLLDAPGSAVALAVNSIAKNANKTYVCCGAGTTKLTQEQCTPVTLHWSYSTAMLLQSTVKSLVKAGAAKWFFITADYVLGHELEKGATAIVEASGGQVMGSVRYPFPQTTDFSSYLLQAQASGATMVGLANAGDDVVNVVKQAQEFGLSGSGIRVAAILATITTVHGLGLQAAQRLLLTESFYWDLNDRTRAFMRRLLPTSPDHYPNEEQAGCYSGTRHYLKSIAALGIDKAADGAVVAAHMKASPGDDDAFGPYTIRADGHVLLPGYLLEAKTPAESTGPWDLLRLVASISGEEAAPEVKGCVLTG
jgi:branched-chain amino acid transport system substrate-binding protein